MSIFGDTFNFFESQMDENERIELGNRLLNELKELGFGFQEQRQILRGELAVELSDELTTEIARYQALVPEEKYTYEPPCDAQAELRRSLAAEEWYQ